MPGDNRADTGGRCQCQCHYCDATGC